MTAVGRRAKSFPRCPVQPDLTFSRHIAIVNDQRTVLQLLSAVLQMDGYQTSTYICDETSPDALRALGPHAVVLDLNPRRPDLWLLLDGLMRPLGAPFPVVVTSTSPAVLDEAARRYHVETSLRFQKPYDFDALREALAASIEGELGA